MIFLKFPDEATARLILANYLDKETSVWITDTHTHSLDPIGVIYQPANAENPEPMPIHGWHVNLIGELPTMPSAYIINPITPSRVFAGVTNDTSDQPSRPELDQGI